MKAVRWFASSAITALAVATLAVGCDNSGSGGSEGEAASDVGADSERRRDVLRRELREKLGSAYDTVVPALDPAELSRGANLYERLCISCHGRLGDGRGLMARHLAIGPGDFTDPALASFLSDQARLEILRSGSPGTTMNGFGETLSDEDLAEVFEVVRLFAPTMAEEHEPAHLFRGREFFDATDAADFSLANQHGDRFALSDHRGEVVLLFFGYIHCPDVCPATLSIWTKLEEQLGEDAQNVSFLFVTVDPTRDSPERMKAQLAPFGEHIQGLTGSKEALAPLYEAYDVRREAQSIGSGGAYLMDHNPETLLIDPQGRLRLRYIFGTPAVDIADDVRWLLR
ncbi:MAG: protein SCO1/2 [Pseudohongiellaceae bacterium]